MKNIKKIFLLGGSISLLEAALLLQKRKFEFFIFTSKRQLNDRILDSSLSLEQGLKKNRIKYFISKDINKDKNFIKNFDKSSLAIGFGEPWKFSDKIIKKFRSNLIDFMCIPLPLFRGGAHYTWMSLMGAKKSAVCLQEITENTLQGVFDDGKILLRKEFKIKKNSKPSFFFNLERKNTNLLLKLFFDHIINKKEIKKFLINEKNSLFLPRLFTGKNGWINWQWKGNDIFSFINSFDEPYIGSSTRYIDNNDKKIIYLKDISWENKKIKFHPFQSGLIINKSKTGVIVATTDGSIKIKKIFDNKKRDIKKDIEIGRRLYSLNSDIELSMTYLPIYNK
jgi:methionyl-tRNA formyltransferase